MKSSFLIDMERRGLLANATDLEAMDELFASRTVTAYIGFDPTANSLHVGNLSQIMSLRLLQKHGHKPIVLIGGATAKVGDPSGKDKARRFNDDATIAENIEGIKSVFSRYLKFGNGETDAILLDNSAWLENLDYLKFLREYGKHFSVNRMLGFDSVKTRLERERPLSFLEFNYMVLQAYDFLELYRNRGCLLQLGGSDQWGNIVNGVELTRKVLGENVYGLTSPLITTASGEKMGKTADGAVWLNASKLRPYDYWQFWRDAADADVIKYLKIFTDHSIEEIERFAGLRGAEINEAKIILADAATALCHGAEALPEIRERVSAAFGGGDGGDLPTKTVAFRLIDVPTLENLMVLAGLCASKGEAKRLALGGGLKIDGKPVNDVRQIVDIDSLTHSPMKVSLGKKRHFSIRVDSRPKND